MTAYISPIIRSKLDDYKKNAGINTDSKAIGKIIEEYFMLLEKDLAKTKNQELISIKQEINTLQTQIKILAKKVDKLD